MTLPSGYRYASTYAGIRKAKKDDLSLVVSDTPASAAAVFTRNIVKAAPVVLGAKHLAASKGKLQAILINAGNANCATRTGAEVASATCEALAARLGIAAKHVLPSSTGVIGVELDPALIVNAIPALCERLSADRFHDVAEAIMTTDLVPKTSFAEAGVKRGTVRIAGMTKGSGMIHPNMATMLGYIVTDAALPPAAVSAILQDAVEASFNRISVDGDMSTNDTLVLMANGASGVKVGDKDLPVIADAVTKVAQHLAEQIARDGEGASRLITINVSGARTEADAARIARAIANSPLVKTAVAGSDPNWGRILCAAGYSGAKFDPRKVDIALQGVTVCASGLAAEYDEAALKAKLAQKDCLIDFRIHGKGRAQCRFWTCDLTEGYIRINGSYRT